MLLLVTILLVLVAAVTLLIGIFSDNLALIFISIGASALAAIVLAVLSQVSKRKGREAMVSSGPEPMPAREPSAVGGRDAERAAASIADVGTPVVTAAVAPTTTMSKVSASGLPIANYDTLRVNEILPALDGLDLDQLEAVAQHEESNKNRTTVLNRIDDRMDQLEAEEGGAASAAPSNVAAAAVEAIEDIGEPAVAVAADGFPIAGYDDFSEGELIPLLDGLDADQLEVVADREEAGQNRDAVLDAIDDRLDVLEGIVPAPTGKKTSAPAKAAAKKVPVKAAATKAQAKKVAASSAKKTPVRKAAAAPTRKAAAAPTRKAAAAPTRRAAAVPAKKSASAPGRKAAAPARKLPAKAPARKAAPAPARKAATARKKATTTAKKSAPVKKATAAKKTSRR